MLRLQWQDRPIPKADPCISSTFWNGCQSNRFMCNRYSWKYPLSGSPTAKIPSTPARKTICTIRNNWPCTNPVHGLLHWLGHSRHKGSDTSALFPVLRIHVTAALILACFNGPIAVFAETVAVYCPAAVFGHAGRGKQVRRSHTRPGVPIVRFIVPSRCMIGCIRLPRFGRRDWHPYDQSAA